MNSTYLEGEHWGYWVVTLSRWVEVIKAWLRSSFASFDCAALVMRVTWVYDSSAQCLAWFQQMEC